GIQILDGLTQPMRGDAALSQGLPNQDCLFGMFGNPFVQIQFPFAREFTLLDLEENALPGDALAVRMKPVASFQRPFCFQERARTAMCLRFKEMDAWIIRPDT